MEILISIPNEKEMALIRHYTTIFVLDAGDLQKQQFLIAKHKDKFIGFGRLRDHKECIELCTLGVMPAYRNKGVGKKIATELMKKSDAKIYVVCIIPKFFEKLGFKTVINYPDSILRKHHMCTTKFMVNEPYCVMQLTE